MEIPKNLGEAQTVMFIMMKIIFIFAIIGMIFVIIILTPFLILFSPCILSFVYIVKNKPELTNKILDRIFE